MFSSRWGLTMKQAGSPPPWQLLPHSPACLDDGPMAWHPASNSTLCPSFLQITPSSCFYMYSLVVLSLWGKFPSCTWSLGSMAVGPLPLLPCYAMCYLRTTLSICARASVHKSHLIHNLLHSAVSPFRPCSYLGTVWPPPWTFTHMGQTSHFLVQG